MKYPCNIRIFLFYWFAVLLAGSYACRPETGPAGFEEQIGTPLYNQLPKALFITTGRKDGNGVLPEGMVIALQALNQKGVVSRLETREILYDRDQLFQYNLLILSTALGYHDADRTYSLSFMADEELEVLRDFVAAGGVLVAGDNVGRNYPDGTDRISVYRRLTPDNFPLASCLGGTLEERYMEDHHIRLELGDSLTGIFREKPAQSKWTLVMDSVFSGSLNVLGKWVLGQDTLPAVTQNRYGKGTAYLLATSDFLEPVTSGGEFSAQQITDLYHFVVDDFQEQNGLPFSLNPWPGGYQQAFCVTLNANGTVDQYQRVLNFLEQEELEPVVFVNGLLDETVQSFLTRKKVSLQSSGFGYKRYVQLNYPESLFDIVKNEDHWGRSFSGFRFPYTSPCHWGLMVLDKKGIRYESSIGANNLTFYHGAVIPHNLVLSKDQFFTTTDILEVAPVYHDDFHFYQGILQKSDPGPKETGKAVQLYQDYLNNYWELGVKPYLGAMVYLGHPAYLGKSDTTLVPLKKLISAVKNEDTWMTTLDEIARFRHDLSQLRFFVTEKEKFYIVQVVAPHGLKVEGLCLDVPYELKKVKSKLGFIRTSKAAQQSRIIFTGENGQELKIWKVK